MTNAPDRAAHLAAYKDAGASRVMTMIRSSAMDADEIDAFREDVVEAGGELDDPTA